MFPQSKVTTKHRQGFRPGEKKARKNLFVAMNHLTSDFPCHNREENSDFHCFADYDADSTAETDAASYRSGHANHESGSAFHESTDGLRSNAGQRRVTVKVKSSKTLASPITCSEIQTPSDTDRSGHHVVSVKHEESPGKPAHVKIKTNAPGDSLHGERKNTLSDSSRIKYPDLNGLMSGDDTRPFNQRELTTALAVIKKIMKMDAAQPFNTPVDPVALGIPDYFDIIEVPMDFGTICANIEQGNKYRNSDDVLRDVQFIWDNCYQYNNKGDYILELMKRAKKNFAKYWVAAGLHYEPFKRTAGMKDSATSSHGKSMAKTVNAKQKKRARHRIDLHKNDCLCAVCVVRRRKRERCAKMESQIIGSGGSSLSHEHRQEEDSSSNYPLSEEGSPILEQSVGMDMEGDMEEQGDEIKWETSEQDGSLQQERHATIQKSGEDEPSLHVFPYVATGENMKQQPQDDGIDVVCPAYQEGMSPEKCYIDEAFHHHHQEELRENCSQAQRIDDTTNYLDPSTLHLCAVLFSSDSKSAWRGPHSLMHTSAPAHESPLTSAVAMLMK